MSRAVLAALVIGAGAAGADLYQTLETDIAFEARYFTQDALFKEQRDESLSLTLSPEWYIESGNHSFTATGFGRWEGSDTGRSHGDIRELHWQGVFGDWEIRVGISKVFWGKTELLHLVDTINQDDALENFDGEDKLGQPMFRLQRVLPFGSAELYVLPYFRERAFVDDEGRLRPPIPVDDDESVFESGAEKKHVDWALRLQGWAGGLDYGLSWFSGTQRDPKFVPGDVDVDVIVTALPLLPPVVTVDINSLFPYYGQMDQFGVDAQYTSGAWLWKLEALWRDEFNREGAALNPGIEKRDRYTAATGGLEYTFYGVFNSANDIGMLVEYLWDERGENSASTFQDDVFVGARLAANDIAGTALLAGVGVDRDHGSQFYNLEFSRRLGGASKLSLEARVFHDVDEEDAAFFAIRRDDYLQLEYNLYF